MAAVQKQFEEFHRKIKLDEDDEKAKLREKRDTLLNELKERLPDGTPSFESFHQGSYAMNTGTVPKDGDYDIDVGLVFDCKSDKYEDPVDLKKIVRDALTRANRTVDIRRPCVTVSYLREGVREYHVDLAIYVKRGDGLLDLAMGKEGSSADKRFWQVSDPQTLTSLIKNRFSGDDAFQFRRCVRYMKRWRDVKFSNGGTPLSIALTVAAYHWFQPNQELSGKYVDLAALKTLVVEMLNNFSTTFHDGEIVERLKVTLPVAPHSDLMSKLSNAQMKAFKQRLEKLRDELVAVQTDELTEDACKRLQGQFGDEFPVPEKKETAQKVVAPFVSAGTSA